MRRVYTDDDRATVAAALAVNDGNVKRTARDTGVPEQTVRDWKKEWAEGGLPSNVGEALPAQVDAFVLASERVRNKALVKLEEKIDNDELNGKDLITAYGVLTDKSRLAQGLATSRQDVQQDAVDPRQFADALGGFLGDIVRAAQQRSEEIIDAEFEEQPQLGLPAPAPTT